MHASKTDCSQLQQTRYVDKNTLAPALALGFIFSLSICVWVSVFYSILFKNKKKLRSLVNQNVAISVACAEKCMETHSYGDIFFK